MSDQNQDPSQKTEDPTPKRIKEAKEKGQVALSREVNNWVMIFASTMILVFMAPFIGTRLVEVMQVYLAMPHAIDASPAGIFEQVKKTIGQISIIFLLPVIVLMVAAFFAPFSQIGPIFTGEQMKPDITKLSPLKGAKRLFGLKGLSEFLKGLAKLGLVTLVSVIVIGPVMAVSDAFVGQPLITIMEQFRQILIQLMIGVLAVMFVVAVLDYMYEKYDLFQKLKMTKQEVKDEYKQTEGDPHVKQRLKELRQQKASQRMMQEVPKADVVITNPTHFAIALKYEMEDMNAPLVIAKGQDNIALKIRELAEENDIPMVENPPLARALHASVEIDEEIPEEHYKAVAEVISYVYSLNQSAVS